MLEMIGLGRPVRIIAKTIGIEHDYCRKLIVKLANENCIDYQPDNSIERSKQPPVGISDASRRFRSRLGDMLYTLTDKSDARAVARQIGMPIRSQKYAKETPFNHDWTLSQIERLAISLDKDFAVMMQEVTLAH